MWEVSAEKKIDHCAHEGGQPQRQPQFTTAVHRGETAVDTAPVCGGLAPT